jgi:hypothetical protein
MTRWRRCRADRDAVVMKYLLGKSHREIAEALHTTEGNARQRLFRTLGKLRSILQRKGLTISEEMLGASLLMAGSQAGSLGLAARVSGAILHASAAGASSLMAASILRSMVMAKIKIVAAAGLAVAVVCGTAAVMLRAQSNPPPASAAAVASIAPGGDPVSDVQDATKKFAAADDYSWTCIGRRGLGGDEVVDGKTQNGVIAQAVTFRNNTSSVLIKGDNAVVKTVFGWTPADVIINATPNYGNRNTPNLNFYPAYLTKGYKAPAVVVAGLLNYLQNIRVTADGYSADLAADGAAQLLMHTRTYNLDRTAVPKISDATGTIKLSIADGALTGYEAHASGTSTFGTSGRAVDQTFIVQIKDVGSTTVDVPPDALAAMTGPATQPSGQ